ncbi:MAG: SGNH/GDSL hydrolase family protein, partial [Oscillospiraceae bacterium]|nr:SGNH/GDSL hydrolase family protein [Oscillospiraceae bacterium]
MKFLKRLMALILAINMAFSGAVPAFAFELEEAGEEIGFFEGETEEEKTPAPDFSGKKVSILGDSISTYSGVSNNAQYNPALGKNVGFYPVNDVTSREETWWQQTADLLGMEVLVNNSSGGGRVLSDETFSRISGGIFSSSIRNEAAYKNRCVSLHNAKGENPEVILVFLGTNDFSYHLDAENCEACSVLAECSLCKGTNTCENCVKTSGFGSSFCLASLGTADIGDYLITENQDGTFAYSVPKTVCEAYAVMLHKIIRAYPDAEVFCLGLLPRRSPDYSGGYHDHGQPTDFNNEIEKIAEKFGAGFINLENCGIEKEAAVFDKYIYDKAVHPNAAGMDEITKAVVSGMLGGAEVYNVSAELSNAEFEGNKMAVSDLAYTAKITPTEGFKNLEITVTMGGDDITETAYADGIITIPCVDGDIVIKAVAGREPENFRWEFDGTGLVSTGESGNSPEKLSGSVSGGLFKGTRYKFEKALILHHDLPWVMEWKGEGTGGFMLSKYTKTNDGNRYFFHRSGNSLEAFGYWNFDEGVNHNYGVSLKDVIDTGSHVYRLENKITAEGNMVYLTVDGGEMFRMDGFFHGGTSQNTTGNWISGKDFVFGYIGTEELPLTDY